LCPHLGQTHCPPGPAALEPPPCPRPRPLPAPLPLFCLIFSHLLRIVDPKCGSFFGKISRRRDAACAAGDLACLGLRPVARQEDCLMYEKMRPKPQAQAHGSGDAPERSRWHRPVGATTSFLPSSGPCPPEQISHRAGASIPTVYLSEPVRSPLEPGCHPRRPSEAQAPLEAIRAFGWLHWDTPRCRGGIHRTTPRLSPLSRHVHPG